MVVSGGTKFADSGMSSKPTTLTSPGTPRPASCRARSTPQGRSPAEWWLLRGFPGGRWRTDRRQATVARAASPGQRGPLAVTRGQSGAAAQRARRWEAAGQRRSGLRRWWWPGTGSNRRPSDFQVSATAPCSSEAAARRGREVGLVHPRIVESSRVAINAAIAGWLTPHLAGNPDRGQHQDPEQRVQGRACSIAQRRFAPLTRCSGS